MRSIENSKQAIRYWWLPTLIGIITVVCGILIFAFPASSYVGISLAFGLMIMLSGLSMVSVAALNTHYITSRGWMIVGGVIEIFLGLLLCFNTDLSASILPYYLGFWLMFRSFSMLGLGFDMLSLGHRGGGSTVFIAFFALLASIIILWQPITIGTSAVVLWTGLSFLFAGSTIIIFSWQLKSLHLAVK